MEIALCVNNNITSKFKNFLDDLFGAGQIIDTRTGPVVKLRQLVEERYSRHVGKSGIVVKNVYSLPSSSTDSEFFSVHR